MLCRVGHHSTSDDSFAYRARQEVEDRKRIDNPLLRLRLFLESRGWWNKEEEEALKARQKKEVLEAFKQAEVTKRWELKEIFGDIYGGEEPWNLVSRCLTATPRLMLIFRRSRGMNLQDCYESMAKTGSHGAQS